MANKLTDKAILDELRTITKNKANWVTAIDDVAAKLGEQYSADVQAKALWLLGEMGKRLPHSVEPYLEKLAWFAQHDPHPVVRIHSSGAIRITKKVLEESKHAADK